MRLAALVLHVRHMVDTCRNTELHIVDECFFRLNTHQGSGVKHQGSNQGPLKPLVIPLSCFTSSAGC